MPMPHRTFAQVAKRRLTGKEGRERVREVNALLAELPDYKNGPYADLRKWLQAEIEDTRVRANAVHRDSIAVRREGAAQIALVGPPNVGKSSLLQALSEIQIKTGDYPFTTLRPVPALTRIGGVLVQLVEIPGLIGGATDDRGGGRALLGVLRSVDAIVYCCRPAATQRSSRSSSTRSRRRASRSRRSSPRPAPTRREPAQSSAWRRRSRRCDVLRVSVLDEASLDAFRVGRLGADRPHPGPAAEGRHDRRRAAGARPGRDRRRRGRLGPPRPGRELQRRAGLGPVGPIRRPARGPRARRRRRGRRRDPALTPQSGGMLWFSRKTLSGS